VRQHTIRRVQQKAPPVSRRGEVGRYREQRELRTAARVSSCVSAPHRARYPARPPGAPAGRGEPQKKSPAVERRGEVVILDGRVGERCRPYSFWRARRARQGNGKPRRPIGTSGAVQRAASLEWSLQPLHSGAPDGYGQAPLQPRLEGCRRGPHPQTLIPPPFTPERRRTFAVRLLVA
jgi:hypothetical protein